ncbi:MAG: hypothetical protein ACOZIN_19865 [Myxococcota bacterium]
MTGYRILTTATLVLCAAGPDAAPPREGSRLPRGWKLAQPVKESGCDRKNSDLMTAKADFDGDKKEDTARLLSKQNGQGLGVWVWLTSKKKPLLVVEFDHSDGGHDMGIAAAGPGTYDTACGRGYWTCKADEPAKLSLVNSGLDIFTCESANQFAWWDSKTNAFMSVWMSD